jgi:hypothetical protein
VFQPTPVVGESKSAIAPRERFNRIGALDVARGRWVSTSSKWEVTIANLQKGYSPFYISVTMMLWRILNSI